ncbi:type 1 glutamine amidotransferase family protein [Clostridium saccharoperbutylacetonicum]|uniref:type 1 glutamine amidotransferase family protein n=1 Tax=Clostridium saccharoperbutylacetonicum TaxID=36745 RepID=UPI000983D3C3|nr:type 1 glutamine amidotransferase family protein [Clostridium saccharoperbutylacetonicum]AQR94867.1 putative protease YdeA [Clostridium saccharoperbutylacetonicum]NSB30708.1 putative intracellular protease/amidase [Clostridium saccharoperbutylacetonicum]
MNNIKNEVLILLTEQWNDWEASYAIAVINSFSDYEVKVKTIAVDDIPKKSMGGINAFVDYSINDYQNFNNLAMVILPGGLFWEENDYNEIAEFIKKIMKLQIPVAAICGATTFLCKHGLLNNVKHTGDSLELFKNQEGYMGEAFYVPAQVVVDNNIITANETAAVEFAYEIFKRLEIGSEDEMEQWYDNFKNGAIR